MQLYDDSIDLETTIDTTSRTDSEYEQFRRWKDERIQQSAFEAGRAAASAEQAAADQAADATALQELANLNLELKDCLGNSRTLPGHNRMVIMQSSPRHRETYRRLRSIAARQGLVK